MLFVLSHSVFEFFLSLFWFHCCKVLQLWSTLLLNVIMTWYNLLPSPKPPLSHFSLIVWIQKLTATEHDEKCPQQRHRSQHY